MSKPDDELLVDELGRLGARGGAWGDALGRSAGLGDASGAGSGGGVGARWVARRLPNDSFEVAHDMEMDAASVRALVERALTSEGRVVDSQETDDVLVVRGIVGAGFLKMNPAVVTAVLTPVSARQTRLIIQGVAKEGLIKQRSGEGAVRRVVQRIKESLPPDPAGDV